MAWPGLESQQSPEQLLAVLNNNTYSERASSLREVRRRVEEDQGTAKKLFPTPVEQLVISVPHMLPRAQKAIKVDPNIPEKVLREQFEKLLLEPLLDIERGKITTRVILIDALDECDSEDDIRVILRLFPQVQKSTSLQLHFL